MFPSQNLQNACPQNHLENSNLSSQFLSITVRSKIICLPVIFLLRTLISYRTNRTNDGITSAFPFFIIFIFVLSQSIRHLRNLYIKYIPQILVQCTKLRVTLKEQAYFWSSWALHSFITNQSLGSFFSWVTLMETKLSFKSQKRFIHNCMMPTIRKVFRCFAPNEIPFIFRICPKSPKFNQVGDKSISLSTNTPFQAFNFIFRNLISHLISFSSSSCPISILK